MLAKEKGESYEMLSGPKKVEFCSNSYVCSKWCNMKNGAFERLRYFIYWKQMTIYICRIVVFRLWIYFLMRMVGIKIALKLWHMIPTSKTDSQSRLWKKIDSSFIYCKYVLTLIESLSMIHILAVLSFKMTFKQNLFQSHLPSEFW